MRRESLHARAAMQRRRSPARWIAAVLAGLLLASEAPAQPADPEATAQARFEQGRAAVKNGDLQRARALFISSQQLYATAGTLLNLADCEERLGLVASAWQHFQEALPMMPADDSRIPWTNERIAALKHRVPRLRIDLAKNTPPGTRVVLDARDVPASSLGTHVPVDPGKYTVTITSPGREDAHFPVVLEEGRSVELSVAAGAPRTSDGSMPATAAPPGAPAAGRDNTLRNVGLAVGGAGILGIGIGAVAGVLALEKKSVLRGMCPVPADCTPEGVRIAKEGAVLGDTSTAGFLVGAPLLVAGAVLVLVHRRAPATEIRATATTDGGGVVVRGSF